MLPSQQLKLEGRQAPASTGACKRVSLRFYCEAFSAVFGLLSWLLAAVHEFMALQGIRFYAVI